MNTLKNFQHLRFPWRFNDRTPFMLVPLTSLLEQELNHLKEGFQFAISETMEALLVEDHATLKKVLEPKLYAEVSDGLNTLRRRGHTLSLVNPTSISYTYLYNEKVYFGMHVDRSKNSPTATMIKQSAIPPNENRALSPENLCLYRTPSKESHFILKLDVVFNSARKFVLFDENQEVIKGEQNQNTENHKFRFECFMERPAGMFRQFTGLMSLSRYYFLGGGKSPINLENWFITDIDDFLEGNLFTEANTNK